MSFELSEIVATRIRKESEMANIGATTAFYKVETSLSRANTEVSKSMERLATGKANANAGDRSSYVAMADTFRLDYVGTKAGIKGASVVMGYLETGMRVLDSASSLLSRLQELAVLGGNDTNTLADHEAINLEAEAIADEFDRLMSSATYKGKDIFVDTAGSEYVSMGGRDAEMTFGIGRIDYSAFYLDDGRTVQAGLPNGSTSVNLVALPSDAVVGAIEPAQDTVRAVGDTLLRGSKYAIETLPTSPADDAFIADLVEASDLADAAAVLAATEFTLNRDITIAGDMEVRRVFEAGKTYEITSATTDATDIATLVANTSLNSAAEVAAGSTFTVSDGVADFAMSADGLEIREIDASVITREIEVIQKLINKARVQAGSQYAALESAVQYTTDLTAQYELGYNTVHDVNFSMETAHLAKNQILQQAATAMLAQANEGQQGLLQLIQ